MVSVRCLTIVLSVLLVVTDSNYPFGIFKLFLVFIVHFVSRAGMHFTKCFWFFYQIIINN
jgi:hypothetical protein